jgi:hypothetical protein
MNYFGPLDNRYLRKGITPKEINKFFEALETEQFEASIEKLFADVSNFSIANRRYKIIPTPQRSSYW